MVSTACVHPLRRNQEHRTTTAPMRAEAFEDPEGTEDDVEPQAARSQPPAVAPGPSAAIRRRTVAGATSPTGPIRPGTVRPAPTGSGSTTAIRGGLSRLVTG